MLDGSLTVAEAPRHALTDGPAPQLGAARPDFALAPSHHPRSGLAPCFALALALHALVACALVSGADEPFGAGGVDLEAISVEVMVVPANALESRARSDTTERASAAAVDQTEGAQTTAADTSATDRKPEDTPRPVEPEKKPEIDDAPAPPKPQVAYAAPDATTPEPDALTLPPKAPDAKPEPRQEQAAAAPQQASVAAAAGGASANAESGQDRPARAAAVASPGAVQAFAKTVVDALSRTRPKGIKGAARGTAKIAFAVAEGGGLEFVRVTRSSGHDVLDEAAVAAVRRALFPAPPAGMALAERTYEIPYHFR